MPLGWRRKTGMILWLIACALFLTNTAKAQDQDVVLNNANR